MNNNLKHFLTGFSIILLVSGLLYTISRYINPFLLVIGITIGLVVIWGAFFVLAFLAAICIQLGMIIWGDEE